MLIPLSLFIITVITRLPFTSSLLYHMDSVQFALALEDYDISVHQPHPPGYFLYVMLGRFFNHIFKDPNATFIAISILFSALTVVTIYYLGKDIFEERTGLITSVFAITSPNLWFHGEIALTYAVEAFFSSAIAFSCWQILKGDRKYLWISTIILGVAGGIRQNTIFFLLPLWIFSLKDLRMKISLAAFGLLGMVSLSWFVPMVWMTGGWDSYSGAFRELWVFNTGSRSVFSQGWTSLKIFAPTLFDFTMYGVGAGIFALGLAGYSLFRHKQPNHFDSRKVIFFSLWILPSILFYLLIFIHPANPGYALIFLPALIILSAASVRYLSTRLNHMFKLNLLPVLTSVIVVLNVLVFLFLNYPVTYPMLVLHDRDLSAMLERIKTFEPEKTAIFVRPYIFFGYRQIMYYLPRYRVYQVDTRKTSTGETRKTFWGFQRETYVTQGIVIPEGVTTFASPLIADDRLAAQVKGISIEEVYDTSISVVHGDISLVGRIYPGLNIAWQVSEHFIEF